MSTNNLLDYSANEVQDKQAHRVIYNETGNTLIKSIVRHEGKPLVLQARRGMGKSIVLEQIGRALDYRVEKVNLFKSAKARTFFGSHYPNQDGTGLHWEDQVWTELCRPVHDCEYGIESYDKNSCSCPKSMLIIDEINRGNEDIQARLLSMTEDSKPYIVLIEKGNDAFELHPNLWLVGTMNPLGGGYSTNPLDAALQDRFRFYEIDKPIADEQVFISEILPVSKYKDMAAKLLNFAEELRKNEDTYMSTRVLAATAKSVVYGEPIISALKVNYINMLNPQVRGKIDPVIRMFFEKDWDNTGGLSSLKF